MIFLQISPWGEESPHSEFMGPLLWQGSFPEGQPLHLTSYGAKLPICSIQCPMISTSQVFRVKSFQIVAKMRIWGSVWFIFSLSLSLANTSWQIPNSSSSKKWDNRKVECDATNKRLFAHFTVLEITIWSINKTVQFWWRPKVMYLVYYFHLFGMRIFGVWIERGPIDFSTCLSSTNMYWYCTFRFVFILYKFISI